MPVEEPAREPLYQAMLCACLWPRNPAIVAKNEKTKQRATKKNEENWEREEPKKIKGRQLCMPFRPDFSPMSAKVSYVIILSANSAHMCCCCCWCVCVFVRLAAPKVETLRCHSWHAGIKVCHRHHTGEKRRERGNRKGKVSFRPTKQGIPWLKM